MVEKGLARVKKFSADFFDLRKRVAEGYFFGRVKNLGGVLFFSGW